MRSTICRHPRVCALAFAAALTLSLQTSAAPEPSVTLPPPLARVLRDYESAWQKKDAKALAALFAEDGFVLAGGSPPVRGRTAIERHYAKRGGPLVLQRCSRRDTLHRHLGRAGLEGHEIPLHLRALLGVDFLTALGEIAAIGIDGLADPFGGERGLARFSGQGRARDTKA